eukprot:TRINITY_DN299_c0_g1_i1.p1 TRINITY_DN299_c0_g1~~TRINITY_DN299_c0_g1_i1.p1  ORF type:complete len:443 (+),score=106.59 TRINITY_DN299_c0_g1_i1:32-1330(+)
MDANPPPQGQGLKPFTELLKRSLRMKATFFVVGGLATWLGIDALYVWHIERKRIPTVLRSFEKGSTSLGLALKEPYFPRPQEEAILRTITSPHRGGFFNLVVGEHGTGKTTVVRRACQQTGAGVVYTRVPELLPEFAHNLAEAVNYDLDVHISFWNQIRSRFFASPKKQPTSQLGEVGTVCNAIAEAASLYEAKHKKPAVLVIDNLTKLAKSDVETFQYLVEFAKYQADEHNLVVNFVASEGNTPQRLKEMSERSRLQEIIEIGDLSHSESVHYLTGRDVDESVASSVVSFSGGRISLLKDAQQGLLQNESVEDIKSRFLTLAKDEFGRSRLSLPEDPTELTKRQIKAWSQIISIVDSPNKEIPHRAFVKSVGDDERANHFLQQNIFAYHAKRDTVSLQSTPIELYVMDSVGERGTSQRVAVIDLLSHLPEH